MLSFMLEICNIEPILNRVVTINRLNFVSCLSVSYKENYGSAETLGPIDQTAERHIPENCTHNHCYQNLKFHSVTD
jgi:hypothetical protein